MADSVAPGHKRSYRSFLFAAMSPDNSPADEAPSSAAQGSAPSPQGATAAGRASSAQDAVMTGEPGGSARAALHVAGGWEGSHCSAAHLGLLPAGLDVPVVAAAPSAARRPRHPSILPPASRPKQTRRCSGAWPRLWLSCAGCMPTSSASARSSWQPTTRPRCERRWSGRPRRAPRCARPWPRCCRAAGCHRRRSAAPAWRRLRRRGRPPSACGASGGRAPARCARHAQVPRLLPAWTPMGMLTWRTPTPQAALAAQQRQQQRRPRRQQPASARRRRQRGSRRGRGATPAARAPCRLSRCSAPRAHRTLRAARRCPCRWVAGWLAACMHG